MILHVECLFYNNYINLFSKPFEFIKIARDNLYFSLSSMPKGKLSPFGNPCFAEHPSLLTFIMYLHATEWYR